MKKTNIVFKFSKKEITRLLCLIISGVSVIIGYSIKNFNVLCTSMIFMFLKTRKIGLYF